MSTNADAADQVVSMSLQGVKVVAEITGAGAKNLAAYLYALMKDQKKTRGKTRLEGLLRSGKELKVFSVKTEDLPTFSKEAKRYGILYCALRDKKDLDGMCDIMVRAEDASKINRIVERFNLAHVDTAAIKTEIEQSRAEKSEKAEIQRENPSDEKIDSFLDELMGEKRQEEQKPNPTTAAPAKSAQSVDSSQSKDGGAERNSLRAELRSIKEEQKLKAAEPEVKQSMKNPANIHIDPQNGKGKLKVKSNKEKVL